MARDGEVVGAVVGPISGLILVHDDIKRPMEIVFDRLVDADDLAFAVSNERRRTLPTLAITPDRSRRSAP